MIKRGLITGSIKGEVLRRRDAAKGTRKAVRRNGRVYDESVRDDVSSCKITKETEMISMMGRIKVKR